MKIQNPSVNLYAYLLVLTLTLSYALYLIEVSDILLLYEIFISIPIAITLIWSIGLVVLIVIKIKETGQQPSWLPVLLSVTVLLAYSLHFGSRNGLFDGEKVLDGAFLDDRSRMDLTLYSNGKYTIYSNWLFGEERLEGQYELKGDTILFKNYPVVGTDFIAQKIIINKEEGRIYFRKLSDGTYDKDFYFSRIGF
ncbi:hypothetical protein [Pontibacter ramchanderi]|uniref:Uncharacterized protein n=1 Tax=Pontibacter ramchanderi TaxID=1179743 RepID=A0A2N3UAT9_9BACT|nr:hypothetical protein [Pontibacter ramchanderi]PKV66455.1 hypothetical protein BD749_1583 [Pontibacter ramchanderi]